MLLCLGRCLSTLVSERSFHFQTLNSCCLKQSNFSTFSFCLSSKISRKIRVLRLVKSGYVFTGPVPNGSRQMDPVRKSDRLDHLFSRDLSGRIQTDPNRTGPAGPGPTGPANRTGSVSERSRVNTWIGSKQFYVNRSRSGPVPCKHSVHFGEIEVKVSL